MSEPDEPVYWQPDTELNPLDLAYALETIRRASLLHYLGGAFEPRHMAGIADLATKALNGALRDLRSVMRRSEQFRKMTELLEDE